MKLYNDNTDCNWLLFGDFNIVLNQSDKFGGNPIDSKLSNSFQEALSNCDMNDLGYKGSEYTWANNHHKDSYVSQRLDRFFANTGWTNLFPSYNNTHLLRYKSDHSPILLEFSTNLGCRNKKHNQNYIKRL